MASLADLVTGQTDWGRSPQSLDLANIGLQRDTALSDQAMQEGVIGQNLPWDLQQLGNQRAAQGGFRSGQTTLQMGHVVQLANQQVAQGRYDVNKQLMELARNRFLSTLGMPLPPYGEYPLGPVH